MTYLRQHLYQVKHFLKSALLNSGSSLAVQTPTNYFYNLQTKKTVILVRRCSFNMFVSSVNCNDLRRSRLCLKTSLELDRMDRMKNLMSSSLQKSLLCPDKCKPWRTCNPENSLSGSKSLTALQRINFSEGSTPVSEVGQIQHYLKEHLGCLLIHRCL